MERNKKKKPNFSIPGSNSVATLPLSNTASNVIPNSCNDHEINQPLCKKRNSQSDLVKYGR